MPHTGCGGVRTGANDERDEQALDEEDSVGLVERGVVVPAGGAAGGDAVEHAADVHELGVGQCGGGRPGQHLLDLLEQRRCPAEESALTLLQQHRTELRGRLVSDDRTDRAEHLKDP